MKIHISDHEWPDLIEIGFSDKGFQLVTKEGDPTKAVVSPELSDSFLEIAAFRFAEKRNKQKAEAIVEGKTLRTTLKEKLSGQMSAMILEVLKHDAAFAAYLIEKNNFVGLDRAVSVNDVHEAVHSTLMIRAIRMGINLLVNALQDSTRIVTERSTDDIQVVKAMAEDHDGGQFEASVFCVSEFTEPSAVIADVKAKMDYFRQHLPLDSNFSFSVDSNKETGLLKIQTKGNTSDGITHPTDTPIVVLVKFIQGCAEAVAKALKLKFVETDKEIDNLFENAPDKQAVYYKLKFEVERLIADDFRDIKTLQPYYSLPEAGASVFKMQEGDSFLLSTGKSNSEGKVREKLQEAGFVRVECIKGENGFLQLKFVAVNTQSEEQWSEITEDRSGKIIFGRDVQDKIKWSTSVSRYHCALFYDIREDYVVVGVGDLKSTNRAKILPQI